MKKVCLLLISASVLSMSAMAQGYKPFKFDISAGYAIPGGTGAKGGVLFSLEPKYAVASMFTVGLRMEAAVVARGYSGVQEGSGEVDVKASASYLLTGDYYFTSNRSFRPFGGVGTGLYSIAAASITDDGENGGAGAGSKFGGLVRTGFEAGHFRMAFEYNIVPSTKLTSINEGGEEITSKNGYIGIKLGVCIGGGKKGK